MPGLLACGTAEWTVTISHASFAPDIRILEARKQSGRPTKSVLEVLTPDLVNEDTHMSFFSDTWGPEFKASRMGGQHVGKNGVMVNNQGILHVPGILDAIINSR